MRLWDFLKDRWLLFLLHVTCMGMLSIFLRLTGYSRTDILLILIFWLLIVFFWLLREYLLRKKYFEEAEKILQKTDQRYLLGELLPVSFRLEDRLYQDMIRRLSKSVIERFRQMEDVERDYREYIESWVHEIKGPITSISLLCENGRRADPAFWKDTLRTIWLEDQKIEDLVEMVLYYARSEQVSRDFLIRETDLQAVAEEVLEKNRYLLIEQQVRAEVECPDSVCTDGKWIAFILNQMILNSVRYCSASPVFRFRTERKRDGVLLTLEDNGEGIPEEELSRIFEKGFTGSNGRSHQDATGMGLYLCRRLCDQLGIRLWAQSVQGEGTKMLLYFPVSSYIQRDAAFRLSKT